MYLHKLRQYHSHVYVCYQLGLLLEGNPWCIFDRTNLNVQKGPDGLVLMELMKSEVSKSWTHDRI